jgi:hypothetical protein
LLGEVLWEDLVKLTDLGLALGLQKDLGLRLNLDPGEPHFPIETGQLFCLVMDKLQSSTKR